MASLTATVVSESPPHVGLSLDWSVIRQNLAPNPSQNVNGTGWVGYGTTTGFTAVRQASGGYNNKPYVHITLGSVQNSTGQGYTCGTGTSGGTNNIVIGAGVPIAASVYIKGLATPSVRFTVTFFDNAGTQITSGRYDGDRFTLTNTTWQRLSATMTTPAGTAYMRVGFTTVPSSGQFQVGDFIDLCACQVEANTGVGGYFDGSDPNCSWVGTVGASISNGPPVPDTAQVLRVHDDGTTYPVRNAEPATLVGGLWVGDDWEAPTDMTFTYTALSSTGDSLGSAPVLIASHGQTWLRHPGKPALNITVNVEAGPDLTHPVVQGVFDVLSRKAPVAITMVRSSARGTLTLWTGTANEASDLLALLEDGSPLLFDAPDGYGLGFRYLAIADLEEVRATPYGPEPLRRWQLPFVTVDRPSGTALATGNSWADVPAKFPYWSNVQAQGDWSDLLAGTGS